MRVRERFKKIRFGAGAGGAVAVQKKKSESRCGYGCDKKLKR